mmetsp:Transcript_21596/g.39646  ORF Transcript_21596/g.39646 Transcript_21596/m.39646 type:complete len:84 (-) Transcript_21596:721-972(-)
MCYFSSKSGRFAQSERHPCWMDWHDGRNEMVVRLPFFSRGSQLISLGEGIIEKVIKKDYSFHRTLLSMSCVWKLHAASGYLER